MQTTRWIDNETCDIDIAINLLMDNVIDDNTGNIVTYSNWNFNKISPNNLSETLNGRNIIYNMIQFSYDQITSGLTPIEDRTARKIGFIIVYLNSGTINYIISRNSGAKTMLRRILSYTNINEIEKNMYDLNSDFFTWLIARVYRTETIIESENELISDVIVDAITGFKGDTEDLLTKVSADGESVMRIISTLSFLLESSNLNQVKLDLNYDNHNNIELVLKKGTVSADVNQYRGEYVNNTSELLTAKLYLLVYLEILPILVQAYQSDFANDLWNNDKYAEFMNQVAQDLTNRVTQKISEINS